MSPTRREPYLVQPERLDEDNVTPPRPKRRARADPREKLEPYLVQPVNPGPEDVEPENTAPRIRIETEAAFVAPERHPASDPAQELTLPQAQAPVDPEPEASPVEPVRGKPSAPEVDRSEETPAETARGEPAPDQPPPPQELEEPVPMLSGDNGKSHGYPCPICGQMVEKSDLAATLYHQRPNHRPRDRRR